MFFQCLGKFGETTKTGSMLVGETVELIDEIFFIIYHVKSMFVPGI
jgi:hypothetical protein